jgi:hypothetical protein
MYGNEINIEIEPFSSKHRKMCEGFDCGNDALNNLLKNAEEICGDGSSVTSVVVNKDESIIIGFYSLNASLLLYKPDSAFPKICGFPAIEINTFAMDVKYQGLPYSDDEEDIFNLSDYILAKVISDIYYFSDTVIGAKFIILYSVPNAVNFYSRNGFKKINDYMLPLSDPFVNDCHLMYFEL